MSRSPGLLTAAGLVAAGLVLVGCGGSDVASRSPSDTGSVTPTTPSDSPTALTSPATPSASDDRGQLVTTAPSEFGVMLFDGSSQAIYLFDKETTSRPRCYDACAKAWPPVLTTGTPRPSGRVQADLLGTVDRRDGSRQVTYAGHPLYYYAHEGTGQVLCHDVVEFGGRWLVVTPDGTPAT